MSTKNLARTVIEGGRAGSDKYDRRTSLRVWRRDNSRYCNGIVSGRIDWEDEVEPERWIDFGGGHQHADKVQPCHRFLASRAGRRWDDVRAEIHAKFNVRTLAGWHVTYAHLIDRVRLPDSPDWFPRWGYRWMPKFWVDETGILRHDKSERY